MVEARIKTTKALILTFAGAISLILLVLGLYNLVEFTDSVAFCGVLCHDVMYPEYTTYQASSHSGSHALNAMSAQAPITW